MPGDTPFVKWFEDVDASATHVVGGKCASLGELRKAGVNVPAGFAVTTHAHLEFLERAGLTERLAKIVAGVDPQDVAAVASASEELRGLVESVPAPLEIEDAIREAHAALEERCGGGPLPVAVRSSATAEDHYTASFAGQLETYLWVQGIDDVLRDVVRCWSGLFTPHAITYRSQFGFADEQVLVSVGIQQMVDARAAGVLFTLNPTNGDRSKVMIESCWGLGEGIVKGEVNPDRFLVDKVTLSVLKRTVSAKEREYRFDPSLGVVAAAPVDDDRRSAPSVSDQEVLELARTGKDIERHYGAPQDVEWAFGRSAGSSGAGRESEGLFILQSRAETVWSRRPRASVFKPGASALEHVVDRFVGAPGDSGPENASPGGPAPGEPAPQP
ncbi:MAG: phenylphosphate synthase subunit beta [Actinomycetota bacterium]|nr:phenylphosphate synthase subunit beta [Actinomycetota bacterium]